MPPFRRYSPLGDPTSCSMDELDFQRWLTERKIPVFEALGLDHTMASLRPIAGGAKLECPVCIRDGENETVQTSNENKKHRHELSKKHSEAIALLLGADPAAIAPEDYLCEQCGETFNRRDSLNRHLAARTCSKVLANTIAGEDIVYKRRLRRAAVRRPSPPSSRGSSEGWPSPALPFPPTLPPSRSQSPPTPLYHSPTIFPYSLGVASSSSTSSSPSPFSSCTPSTSRSASPLLPAADEFCFAFEDILPPAEATPAPAAPVPSTFDETIVFDAYRPFDDGVFPICALAADFSPVQPTFDEPAMIDLLNLTLEDFVSESAPEYQYHQPIQAIEMPFKDDFVAILCSGFQ